MEDVKRIRYFEGEVLESADFKTEQEYNRGMRHNHNRYFHTWGIAGGLEVAPSTAGNTKVTVSPGIAVDGEGREIVLATAVDFDFSGGAYQGGSDYFLTIRWAQKEAEPRQETPPQELKRWLEAPQLEAFDPLPADPETTPVLAKVSLNADQTVAAIDAGVRKYSGIAVRSDSVDDYHLRENAVTTPKIKDKAVTRAKINDGSVNEEKLSTAVTGKLVTNGDNHTHTASDVGAMFNQEVKDYVDDLFCGSISAFAVNEAPPGWLECSGQLVSRSQFPRLFAKIGAAFGAGDGSTTFNVPDLRGEFIRGWDHGRGIDNFPNGRPFGSFQFHQILTHKHFDSGHNHFRHPSGAPERVIQVQPGQINGHNSTNGDGNSNPVGAHTGGSQANIGEPYQIDGNGLGIFKGGENRPRNIALLYCIKY
jgi:microcystin-dependent protein